MLDTTFVPWHEVGANIATVLGVIGIIVIIIEHYINKEARNIQLMQRCIDEFRKWLNRKTGKIDIDYLDFLNEELFYFQNRLIQKKVAIEWIEGILDYVAVYSQKGDILNDYSRQSEIKSLSEWKDKSGFYKRIDFFIKTNLDADNKVPPFSDESHSKKKRYLANELYKHIRSYKY